MSVNTDSQKINELLTRGVEEIIIKESLEEKLKSGKKLRIKFGIDPTGSNLHLGHAVPLRKLREFQEMGHQVILLIGDYTAMVGDPTGRNETRPLLTEKEVKKNMKTYKTQAGKVLDMKRVELRKNSEWYGKRNVMELFMELTGKITVARVLDRDDFQKRMKEGHDIQMQEILYPLMQGYDSVELKADVEIGGTDQKFNMLMGRKLQKRYDQPEQNVMTISLLEGIDGQKKMSKSYGNYIGLLDSAAEMFGKAMSVPDELIIKYFELATDIPPENIVANRTRLANGENPRDLKMELAAAIVKIYHGEKAAALARENFINTFSKKETPDEMPEVKAAGLTVADALVAAKLVSSKSDASRKVEQGGVKINEKVVHDAQVNVKAGDVVQKGKRFFVKIK